MREIKFRCFDGEKMKPCGISIEGKYESAFGSFNYPLMQFTGLKDKNGVEIYEGDIVRFIDTEVQSNESGTSYDDFEMIESVVWNEQECGWDVSSRNYIDRSDFIEQTEDSTEVIGNIYQNPELI